MFTHISDLSISLKRGGGKLHTVPNTPSISRTKMSLIQTSSLFPNVLFISPRLGTHTILPIAFSFTTKCMNTQYMCVYFRSSWNMELKDKLFGCKNFWNTCKKKSAKVHVKAYYEKLCMDFQKFLQHII